MIVDKSVVPGAGAFQVACAAHLSSEGFRKQVKGKAKYGVSAFAEAILVIPKTLAANSGHDIQDCCKPFHYLVSPFPALNVVQWRLYKTSSQKAMLSVSTLRLASPWIRYRKGCTIHSVSSGIA